MTKLLLKIGLVVMYKLCRPILIYLRYVRRLCRTAWSTTRNYIRTCRGCSVFAVA